MKCWKFLALLVLAGQARAMNLIDVYQLAIQNDQSFAAATASRQASIEALPQAMAVWFPQLSATAISQMNWVYQNVDPTYQKYNNHGYTVTASQQLINFNNWFAVDEAKATVNQANATYGYAAQDLMTRTSSAYFTVLQASDSLGFIRAEKALVKKELDQAKARFEVGVDAIDSVYNAEASYDSLVAQEITAINALIAAYQNLQVITGVPIHALQRLRHDMPMVAPTPGQVQAWQNFAGDHNLTLKSYVFAAQASRQAVKASNANHLPTVSADASYTYNRQNPGQPYVDNPTTYPTLGSTSAAAVQVSIPIFSGGAVMSQTREAQANYAEANANLQLQYRQVLANVYQTFSSVQSGISQIQADQQAVKSKNNAVDSNQAAYQAGTMTIIDVLNAISDLYNAQQVYAKDQYTYLQNTLVLKQLAGNLTDADMVGVNHWLTTELTPAADTLKPPVIKADGVAQEALTKSQPEMHKLMQEADQLMAEVATATSATKDSSTKVSS